jgi:hypothetical protein
MTIDQIVVNDRRETGRSQGFARMRANITGSSGDQYRCHFERLDDMLEKKGKLG